LKDDSFKDFILDQLHEIRNLEARRMFGAYGIYADGKFFGIIDEGRIYFKTDDAAKERYKKRGMKPFRPTPKQTLKNYYEVPVDIIEDSDSLTVWANDAIQK